VRRRVVLLSWMIGLTLLGLGFDEPRSSTVDIALDAPTSRRPVVAGAALAPAKVNAGGTVTLVVKAKVAPSWHIYAADLPTGSSIPTTLKLKLPKGVSLKGDWTYPVAAQNASDNTWVYEGELTFQHALKVAPDVPSGPIEVTCEFGYQACDPSSCRPPTKIDLKARADVLPAR
jgi:DsbC/DsbD-like thiol-disulfide interchange protein